MKVKINIEQMVGWDWCKRLFLRTINKKPKTPMPTREQKLQWLMSEHSPIKVVQWCIDVDDLMQWVGVHLLRHPFLLPFIASQRGDKTKDKEAVLALIRQEILDAPEFNDAEWRNYRLQGSENNHSFVVNAQTLINMSRKRLCRCASAETRAVWEGVKAYLAQIDPEMAAVMQPNCIYRGGCPEMECCGYVLSKKYAEERAKYWALIPSPEQRLKKK